MTTEEALRVIYEGMGWKIEDWPRTIKPDGRKTFGLPKPQEDTTAGLAEFARLLLWAWKEFETIELNYSNGEALGYWADFPLPQPFAPISKSPQEAFVLALGAALEARKGGGE